MSIDVNATMDAIGTALATITGLRVFDYPTDLAQFPCAVVGLPTEGTYDVTAQPQTDRASFPVIVMVGALNDRSARDQLSAYLAGSGVSSVRAAVDGTLGGVVQAAHTTGWTTETRMSANGVDLLVGATFNVEVWK